MFKTKVHWPATATRNHSLPTLVSRLDAGPWSERGGAEMTARASVLIVCSGSDRVCDAPEAHGDGEERDGQDQADPQVRTGEVGRMRVARRGQFHRGVVWVVGVLLFFVFVVCVVLCVL